MPDYAMSKHALSRAVDMALDADEIRRAVERPRSQHWSDRTQSWQNTNGRVTACLRLSDEGVWTVTTILWAKASGWVADSQFGPTAGRGHLDAAGVRSVAKARRRDRH